MLRQAGEVEAAAAGQPGQRSLILVGHAGRRGRAGRRHQLKLHQVGEVELRLGECPQSDAPVGRNREEVEILGQVLVLPANLPHRVRVLALLDGRLEDGRALLGASVVDGHGAVVQPDAQDGRVLRVPIKAHDARLGLVAILGEGRVLQRVHTQEAHPLLHKVERAVPDREEVGVLGVPLDGRHMLALGALVVELPQREQCALALAVQVGRVLPEAEVVRDVVVRVLVDHALEDLGGVRHLGSVDCRLERGHRQLATVCLAALLVRLAALAALLLLALRLALSLMVLHVRVEHVPLRRLASVLHRRRRLRHRAALLVPIVQSLRCALREVELVAHS
eukprot:scaffold13320_cov118-Isochrysis_galbana.AAC.4